MLAECRKLGGAATGEVKLTSGHALPARMIAHAVGPVYSKRSSQKSEELLRSCYRNTLDMAVENELRTVVRLSNRLCSSSTRVDSVLLLRLATGLSRDLNWSVSSQESLDTCGSSFSHFSGYL